MRCSWRRGYWWRLSRVCRDLRSGTTEPSLEMRAIGPPLLSLFAPSDVENIPLKSPRIIRLVQGISGFLPRASNNTNKHETL
ncbi:unnamed protein product [Sphagnum balticum]